ncbi:MAG: discoidin domain-containing protein, partial [Candidatus Altiarchaeales archaeon]|nr:discoidin domain-containing protein [Candidatus Altiarchaeales archaeon]
VIGYVINTLEGAKVKDIIGKTTAEQNPLCGGLEGNILERAYHILQRGCLLAFYNSFGIGYWFSLIMIPILLYFILKKRSFGAVFLLSWALPMIWGVANKSQYQFTASVPIVALGATIGLIMAMKREDWETLRVIPTLILLAVILLLPMLQVISPVSVSPVIIGPFGGLSAIHAGLGVSERIYWDETLKWIGKQPEDTTVLTWWDYGHWIAAISERTSIADNTKGRPFIVQDLARFHVLVENETEALEIAKKYNSTNVVIDYTMIGKSGAPHFIATSGLGGYMPPTQMSVECSDGRNCDHLVDDEMEGYASVYIGGNRSGSILIDLGGIYVINRTEMHLWDLDGRYYQYKIEVSTDAVNWQEVVDKTDGEWRGLQADSFSDVNAALVRITGTYASVENEFRVLGIRIYNPKYDGSYAGYGQCLPVLGGGCQFYRGRNKHVCDNVLINRRNLKESWASHDGGGFDKVRTIVFECNSHIVGLIFNIKNDRISSVEVVDNRLDTISWKNWQDLHHDSVLGIQPLIGNKTNMGVLTNIVTYADNPRNYVDFPTFKLLVYVPEEFNNYMMTRLYLGDYMYEYKEFGLCDPSVRKLEHFKLVGEFRGDLKSYYSGADSSHLGYVRAYEIDYPEAEQ